MEDLLRYDGPIVRDVAGAEEVWTVLDKTSSFYKWTLGAESLLHYGFSQHDLDIAKTHDLVRSVKGDVL